MVRRSFWNLPSESKGVCWGSPISLTSEIRCKTSDLTVSDSSELLKVSEACVRLGWLLVTVLEQADLSPVIDDARL